MSKQGKTLGFVMIAALVTLASAAPGVAQTRPSGRLAGMVVDSEGKPQMGATVWVGADGLLGASTIRVRTNQAGRFVLDFLPTGAYDVRVTLAGFMPVLNRNVVVSANATTVLKLELGSVVSAVAKMRTAPKSGTEPDDWDWVLRSSTNTRPVLRWRDEDDTPGQPGADAPGARKAPRGRVELTSGDTEPGIASSLTQSAFAYDQPIGIYGKLLLAGQFSYDAPGTAAVATTWVPFGESANSPRTTFAMRQYRLTDSSATLRTLRTEQAGSVRVSDRVTVRYAAEYVWLSLRNSTSALDPRADVTVQLAQGWTATMSAGTVPAREPSAVASLESAVGQLGIFPSVMFTSDGNAIIGRDWHEEARLEHKVGKNGEVAVAAFHDQSSHTPVFATSTTGGIQAIDVLPIAHAVDGGGISSYGARFAYRRKLSENLDATVVYAWAGALTADSDTGSDGAELRSLLQERSRHSLAFGLSGRIQKTKTRLNCSYKWVNGLEASRQDPNGESLYNLDPFLNVGIRQPLPQTWGGGRIELVADLLNVLNEGTSYRNTADGRMSLTPAPRILRGGLSFQF